MGGRKERRNRRETDLSNTISGLGRKRDQRDRGGTRFNENISEEEDYSD